MAKKAILVFLLVFLVFGIVEITGAQENIIPVTVIRVSQSNVVAVSYTHLDVYKRQIHRN